MNKIKSIVSPSLFEKEGNLFFNQKPLYSLYAPQKRASQLADFFKPQKETLYFLLSPLLGYGVDLIIKKCKEIDAPLILIEINEELYQKTKINNCIYFNFNEKESSQQILKKQLDTILISKKIRKVNTIALNEAYRLQKELYNEIVYFAQKEIDFFWKNRSTLIFFKDLLYRNIFRNLLLKNDSCEISQENYPYFVCGAGESLENSIQFLKEHRTALRIIAADSALPLLLKFDIIPDFVIILESQIANLADFLYKIPQETIFLVDRSSCFAINKHLKNKKWIQTPFFNSNLENRMDFKGSIFPQSGSVGVAALLAALMLTKGKIYITGLDFCFQQGKTHANGTESHEKLLRNLSRFKSIEENYRPSNKTVVTVSGFVRESTSTLISYATLIAQNPINKHRIFDIRNTGIPLGYQQINQEDIQFTPQKIPPLSILQINKSNLSNFFKIEMNELKNIEDNLINDKLTINQIKKVDYLHYFFPDYSLSLPLSNSYKMRMLFYIRKFNRLFEKLIHIGL